MPGSAPPDRARYQRPSLWTAGWRSQPPRCNYQVCASGGPARGGVQARLHNRTCPPSHKRGPALGGKCNRQVQLGPVAYLAGRSNALAGHRAEELLAFHLRLQAGQHRRQLAGNAGQWGGRRALVTVATGIVNSDGSRAALTSTRLGKRLASRRIRTCLPQDRVFGAGHYPSPMFVQPEKSALEIYVLLRGWRCRQLPAHA